jgi:alkylhydroperoxidase/carboxymuconolactone decarboxylase family protein YurZ
MDKEAYETLAKIKQGNDPGTELRAEHDPDFFAGLKSFYADSVLGRENSAISRATKEMVIMVSAAAMRSWDGMKRHLAKALDHGAKPREILEFLEATSVNAGIPVVWRGSQALAEELKKRNQRFE